MLKYVAVFSFEVGGGHTPLSLSCYATLLENLEYSRREYEIIPRV